MQQWILPAVLVFTLIRAASAQVLMEVPLLLEFPGKEKLVRAWYDGEAFLVDGEELFQALGFAVQLTGTGLEALDTRHRHTFSCSNPPAPPCRIFLTDVLDVLGRALHFDQNRLHLTASSAASMFDVRSLRARQRSRTEVPGPHLFGRTRSIWGGMMASWQLRRDAFGVHPFFRFTGSILHGSLEAELSDGASWTYRYDRPEKVWLTQVQAGRNARGSTEFAITNVPLARRRLHRMRYLRGRSDPHALIQAVIRGEVVDQVQADTEGYYELNAPVWYGTTKLEIRTHPLGGRRTQSDPQYLLTPTSMVPPGKVFYGLRIGEQHANLHVQYGIHPRWTLRSAFAHHGVHPEASVGSTWSPVTFLAVSTEVQLLSAHWQTGFQLWHSGVQVTARLNGRKRHFQNLRMTASAGKGPVSALLQGSMSSFLSPFNGRGQRLSLHPAVWLHHHGGLRMQAGWESDWLHGPFAEAHHRWHFGAGWMFSRVRVMGFATRDDIQSSYGLEGIFMLGHSSLAFRAGWDADHQMMTGRLSFQMSSPFGSLFARGQRDVRGITHSQQIQGSIHLWDRVQLAPYGIQQSAVELRIFEDRNGNGLQEDTEPILPHIEAELFQGGWTRLRTGALYAAHLEPYQRYQIRILEASIRDPSLHPATGPEFSFTADPGQRKILHVPMQRFVPVTGMVTGLDRTPLRLNILLDQEKEAEVYRDGGFTLHLRPGRYTLTVVDILDQIPLAEKTIQVDTRPIRVVIHLGKDRR